MGIGTYQSVVDALDSLANGKPARTNGKITAVNLAKEAGISKATLYRLFDDHKDIRAAYEALRKNGIRLSESPAETVEQANRLLKDEVKRLRKELADIKRSAEQSNKTKAHQIQVLWLENQRLQRETERLQKARTSAGSVVEFRVPKG